MKRKGSKTFDRDLTEVKRLIGKGKVSFFSQFFLSFILLFAVIQ